MMLFCHYLPKFDLQTPVASMPGFKDVQEFDVALKIILWPGEIQLANSS